MTTRLRLIFAVLAFATAGAQVVNPPASEPEYALLMPMSALQRRASLAEMMMAMSMFAGDRDNQIYFQGRMDATNDLIKMLNDAIPKPVTPQ